MIALKVIDGIKKEKPNYRKLYGRAFIKTLERLPEHMKEISDYDLDTKKKLILYGVKHINLMNIANFDYKLLINTLTIIIQINNMMSTLTPHEFQTIFPISKDYNGTKFGMKDYFYTKAIIKKNGVDKVIGDNIHQFQWDYQNWELHDFLSQSMCVMSAIRRSEGQKGIMEEFAEKEGITAYTQTEDGKGKKVLVNNNTGEVLTVKKVIPKYLKIIK